MPWKPQHPDDFPSLGWEILDWCAEFLPSPRDPSSKLLFTDEQAMQIVEWFRLDPLGRLVYRRGYSRRSKGWGKSPVEAAKAIAEFAGPVRFGGWNAAGQPVGMPWGTKDAPRAWVQIGAISEDQTDNTWSVIHYLLTENDGRAADALKIDAGLTRCFLPGQPGAKMEPVTSAAGSREGQPITYGVIDESHLMVAANGGVKLAKVIRRNVAKMGGRSYETTNSYEIGLESVAETSHMAVLTGSPGIFADEIEAPRSIDGRDVSLASSDADLLAALSVAYGKSWWVDKERLIRDIRDPSNEWTDSARFFFNWPQKHNADSGPISINRWAELVDPDSIVAGQWSAGIDVSPDMAWTSIASAGRRADGQLHVNMVRRQAGTAWVIPFCKTKASELGVTFRIAATGPGGFLIAQFEEAGIPVEAVSAQEVTANCGRLISAATEGTIHSLGGNEIPAALSNATITQGSQGTQSWSRVKSSGDISALVAATIAVGGVGESKVDLRIW